MYVIIKAQGKGYPTVEVGGIVIGAWTSHPEIPIEIFQERS